MPSQLLPAGHDPAASFTMLSAFYTVGGAAFEFIGIETPAAGNRLNPFPAVSADPFHNPSRHDAEGLGSGEIPHACEIGHG